jgi:hypothetical protein
MRAVWLAAAIACFAAGVTLIAGSRVAIEPLPPIPPTTDATPVWFGGDLAQRPDPGYWATVAFANPVPTAAPVPPRLGRIDVIYRPMEPEYWIGKERPTQLQDPCHGPLRGAACPPLFVSRPGPMQ